MKRYHVIAQSYTSTQRVQRVVVAADEAEALLTANMTLNGDFYVICIARKGG